MYFFDNKFFLIALTFIVYLGAQLLQKKLRVALLNPILVTTAVLIVFLVATDTDYATYQQGGAYIDFWLKPAVVALALPLYRQLNAIRKQLIPILLSEVAGCVIGLVSVVVLAELLGASREVVVSLAPKSVTTPIAIEISKTMNGIPALTTASVIIAGLLGNMAGFRIIKMTKIKSHIAGGLSIGTASHAIGTVAAMEKSQRIGAYSSLGLILNGLFTALLAPIILSMLGYGGC